MLLTKTCRPFAELTAAELYELMRLRQMVFVVEQNCAYLDADGLDLHAYHLWLSDERGTMLASARLLPVGVPYQGYLSIGRVASHPEARGTGAGKQLMEWAINESLRLWGSVAIMIGAQSYLLRFYTSLGFVSTGKEYLEDGIPHTIMVRTATP